MSIQGSSKQFVTEDLQKILLLKQWGTSTPGEGMNLATTTSVEVAHELKFKNGAVFQLPLLLVPPSKYFHLINVLPV